MWRNETVLLLFELFTKAVVAVTILTAVGALVLFGMRVYIDSL